MKTIKKERFGRLLLQAFFMSVLCLLSACSDDNGNEVTNVPEEWIQGLPESVSFKVNGGEQSLAFTLAEGVDASQIAYIMPKDAEAWCDISIGSNSIDIKVAPFGYSRMANVTLIYGKNRTKVVQVAQTGDFSDYFKDDVCSELRDDITEEEIATIPNEVIRQIASELYNGEYDKNFRVASFRPYQNPEIMAKKNKTNKYSLRDNVTGIWAEAGEVVYVMVGDIYEGGNIELMFHGPDKGYGNSKNVPVIKGFNKIIAPITGQIYVLNQVADDFPLNPESEEMKQAIAEKTVNIHFVTGRVNGYIDRSKHIDNDEWKNILAKADYEFIDIVGKYAHVTWKAGQWRDKNTDLAKVIENFDNLVYYEQDFAGLVKYNRMFNNRLHFCADYTAKSPNASDYRTVYATKSGTEEYWDEVFYDPYGKYVERIWVAAHEAGHCNQLRPGAKWTGMSEVTNNIYCLYAQFIEWGGDTKLGHEQMTCIDENGKKLPKDVIYKSAKKFIVDGKRAHCLASINPDDIKRESQLVVFWQLYLYVVQAKGQTNFYKDLYEQFRNNPSPSETGKNPGMDQLDFVRQACKYSNLDLTEFFEQWGFLTPVNALVNDYASKQVVITQQDIDSLKEEIKNAGYTKAASDIYNITDANWEEWKDK